MPRKRRAPSTRTEPETRSPHTVPPSDRRLTLALAIGILIAAAGLRAVGAGSDLWLDEIWGLQTATGMRAATDVLTLHHEINHHLNTLWLYVVGSDASPIVHRLPALLSGVLIVAVAGLIGLRRSTATGIAAMLLTAGSYELVLYSSEARGYSTLVLCSLLAFYCLERYHEEPGWMSGAGYVASALLGLLSHATFAAVLAAGAAWSAWRVAGASGRGTLSVGRFAAIQGIPLAALAALYLVDLRFVVAGGGTPTDSLIDAYGASLAWAMGTPGGAAAKLLWCIAGVVALDAGLRGLWRERADAWTFFAGTIVVFPILLIVVRGSELVYTRHFIAGSTFLLILVAQTLGGWWDAGRRMWCVAAIVVYAATNGWHISELAANGRGRYQDAIRYMAEHTTGPVVTIAGDHDFRIGVELSFYMPRVLGSKEGRYFNQGSWPAGGPEWIVGQRESFEPATPLRDQFIDPAGHQYELVRTFPAAPLSGLHWFLFHRRPGT